MATLGQARNFTAESAIKAGATYDASKLAGKSVVITGGASGLGEAFMRAFVTAGAFVTFGDVAADRGKKLLTELGSNKVAFVPCNVLVWADQVKLFKTAIEKSPAKTIDYVCANAGIGAKDDILTDDVDANGDPVEPQLDTLKVNLIGMAYTAKLAVFYLAKQPEGADRDRCLIMTASMAGYLDQPNMPQYNASKWGTRGLMRSLRNTIPAQGMRVSILAPWFVRTRIVPEQLQGVLDSRGMEWASASDAAEAVLHIASDKLINGRTLAIVPRTIDPRGYLDMQKDNNVSGNPIEVWKNLGIEKTSQ